MQKRHCYLDIADHFKYQHENPPAPFNPAYLPRHGEITARVRAEMEDLDYYANHTRIECAARWKELWLKHRAIIYPNRVFED